MSLSTFDLRQEAPVRGWPVQRELPLVLVVPWAGLAAQRTRAGESGTCMTAEN